MKEKKNERKTIEMFSWHVTQNGCDVPFFSILSSNYMHENSVGWKKICFGV